MTTQPDDLSPMRQQYLEIKAAHQGAIVLFRLGDFYEAFDADAETIARELDLTLTGRGTKNRIPMAGVPYHAVENYIARLVEKGYHVVIVEQMEPPGKKLVRREVTRIITPGTVVEPTMLATRQHNYLLAVAPEADRTGETWGRVGLAYVDITTGEFMVTQIGEQDQNATVGVVEELARLQPREVLLPQTWSARGVTLPSGSFLTAQPDTRFDLATCRRVLLDHFQTATLDGFGLADKPLAVRAAGALVQFVAETQRGNLPQLATLQLYSTSSFMVLDASTRRNLELTETLRANKVKGSLLGVLDRTITPMGGRLLRTWIGQPLLDLGRLQARQEAVSTFYDDALLRAEVMETLKSIADLERITNRVLSGHAGPRELLALRSSLQDIPLLRAQIENQAMLQSLLERLDPCTDISDLISLAIDDNPPAVINEKIGVIRAGYSPELDEITVNTRDAKAWIASLEATERERTGIKSLKVGFNKVFGYYIEISYANAEKVPDDYIRKQTLVNAERYITPTLKEYETLVLNAEERMIEIETRLYKELCYQIASRADRLLRTARAVAYVDVFAGMAETAAREGYTRPELTDEDVLIIHAGRHPVVEQLLQGEQYVPNDTHFDANQRIHLITGPNMAGKSTAIRQVALIVLMAQIGSFVPATEARIGLVDRIFTRIGAHDEIHAGQSTFMVEMIETSALLQAATSRSLLILDEIGRGTSTYDGLAIARAVIEFIHNHPRLNCKTLFATHYHELTELEQILPRTRNYNVAVLEDGDRVVFLHRVVAGGTDRSYGIHVAQLAGMPKPLIKRAQEILQDLEAQRGDFSLRMPPTNAAKPAAKGSGGQSSDQLPLFAPAPDPLAQAILALRVEEMSPLEAMTKLYELQRLARAE